MPKKPETTPILIRNLDAELWKRFRMICVRDGMSATGKLRLMIQDAVERGETGGGK